MIRVLIADDHAIVRQGLKQIVSETSDIEVCGEASNGAEAFEEALARKYDVVLLDVSMPVRDGLDVLRQLRRERPRLPVLMLSMHPEEQYAVRALRDGASGYLPKESAPDELVTAIRKVASGGKYVTPSLAERLASFMNKDFEGPAHETLSDREFQVMILIAQGKTQSEIAEALSLSVKTISTYRGRILEKLGLSNNAEIMSYALNNGLVK
jgi:DNA-binding NarL/FixJ family response regulator